MNAKPPRLTALLFVLFFNWACADPGWSAHPYGESKPIENQLDSQSVNQQINQLVLLAKECKNSALHESLNYLHQALAMAPASQDSLAITRLQLTTAHYFQMQGKYKLAMEYCTNALRMAPRENLACFQIKGYIRMGSVQHYMENYDRALGYFHSALELRARSNCFHGVEVIYQHMGHIYRLTGQFDAAVACYERCLGESADSARVTSLYNELGKVQIEKGCYEEALVWLNRYADYRSKKNPANRNALSESCINRAKVYNHLGRTQEAIPIAKNGLLQAEEIGNREHLKEHHENLAEAYGQLANFEAAYAHQSSARDLERLLLGEQVNRQVSELEIQYESERKNNEIAFLKQQQTIQELRYQENIQWTVVFLGIALLLVIGVWLWSQVRSMFERQQYLELEHRLLRSQMNPHFIFNTMMAIRNYVHDHDLKSADLFFARTARMIRNTLNSTRTEQVSLQNEIGSLTDYLELQLLRFEGLFEYRFDLEVKSDLKDIGIPPMLLQPFVENAIEHGLKKREDPHSGEIIISIRQLAQELEVILTDNGVGRAIAAAQNNGAKKNHLSLATSITQERLAVLRKKYGRKIRMEIIDLATGTGQSTGTKVVFHIPILPVDVPTVPVAQIAFH